jgi:hypothetical protein
MVGGALGENAKIGVRDFAKEILTKAEDAPAKVQRLSFSWEKGYSESSLYQTELMNRSEDLSADKRSQNFTKRKQEIDLSVTQSTTMKVKLSKDRRKAKASRNVKEKGNDRTLSLRSLSLMGVARSSSLQLSLNLGRSSSIAVVTEESKIRGSVNLDPSRISQRVIGGVDYKSRNCVALVKHRQAVN